MASIDELLSLSSFDVSKMSRRELANVVSKLSSAANKRLRRLERSPMGTESRAYQSAMKRGNFSVAGKNQGQLQNEYKRVTAFLRSKTSSVSGWKAYRKSVYERIGGKFDSEESEKAFWRAYRKIAGSEQALHNSYGSGETQRYLRQEMSNSKPLTADEKERYRELFPDDKRKLTRLSQLDRSVIRTLIEMGEGYEEEQSEFAGNGSFFKIWSDDS